MKTNFSVATRAMMMTALQLSVLSMALQAAPSVGEQNSANARAEASALRLTNPRRAAKSSCEPPAQARGVRFDIRGNFQVTNSDDGFRDNDVEVYGYVDFNGERMWAVQGKNAITAKATTDPRNFISIGQRSFHLIFNDPSTWMLKVDGFLLDHDKGSGDDKLWNPRRKTLVVNMKQLYERRKAGLGRSITLRGDQDSESADLILDISPARRID